MPGPHAYFHSSSRLIGLDRDVIELETPSRVERSISCARYGRVSCWLCGFGGSFERSFFWITRSRPALSSRKKAKRRARALYLLKFAQSLFFNCRSRFMSSTHLALHAQGTMEQEKRFDVFLRQMGYSGSISHSQLSSLMSQPKSAAFVEWLMGNLSPSCVFDAEDLSGYVRQLIVTGIWRQISYETAEWRTPLASICRFASLKASGQVVEVS